MYYLNGIKDVIKIIQDTCNITCQTNDLSNKEFKRAYHKFLEENSIFEVPITWDSMKFTDFPGIKCIASKFHSQRVQFFSDNSEVLKNRLEGEFFNQGLKRLQNQSNEIYKLIQFLTKVVLINQLKSYTNGTTQETIGLCSLDFKDNFEQQDFIELLVHQMTHMILFMDDRNKSHMLEGCKEIAIETELKSKLGGNKFPVYIAFHSYIVGVEALCFRQQTTGFEFNGNYHGNSERMFKVCKIFQNALDKEMRLFTSRGQTIFEKSVKLFNETFRRYQIG
jgi:hypothetical protein